MQRGNLPPLRRYGLTAEAASAAMSVAESPFFLSAAGHFEPFAFEKDKAPYCSMFPRKAYASEK